MLQSCVLVFAVVLGTKAANLDPLSHHDELGIKSTKAPDNNDGDLHDTMMKDESVLSDTTEQELSGDLEDWQADMSLHEMMEYLFVHKVGADVAFTVIDKEGPSKGVPFVFQAHKTVLMARFSVMFALLNNNDPGTETNTPTTSLKEITLTDVDPGSFREMLRYMYTDKSNITPDNVLYIAAGTSSYNLLGLQKLVVGFLQRDLSNETVFDILKHAVHFSYDELIQKCVEMIAQDASSLLKSPKFLEITMEMLTYILDIEKINCYEVELFRACVEWAKAECQRKNCSTGDKGKYIVLVCIFLFSLM